MDRRWRIPSTGALLLVSLAPLYYARFIFNPFVQATQHGRSAPGFGSDLYPRWVGIRAALHRENPYGQAVTSRIQTGYYGYVLGVNEHRDPQKFAYPAHVAVVLAPFAWPDFPRARTLFTALLVLATILETVIWVSMETRRSERGPRARAFSLALAAILILGSWPVVEGLDAQQVTLLAAAFLAGAFYCAAKGRFGVAGVLLAFSTIKPQLSWLAICWLLVWSLSKAGRSRLAWWMIGACALFVVASELLVPGWPRDWFSSLHDYMSYTGSRLNLQILLGRRTGALATVAWGTFCCLELWRRRHSEGKSEQFGFAAAFVLAFTLLCLPTWSWASYNQVLLVPAALYLARNWRRGMASGLGVRLSHGLAMLALSWSYLGTLYLVGEHLLHRTTGNESELQIPTYNFFVVAPLTLLSLYLVRPKHWVPDSAEAH